MVPWIQFLKDCKNGGRFNSFLIVPLALNGIRPVAKIFCSQPLDGFISPDELENFKEAKARIVPTGWCIVGVKQQEKRWFYKVLFYKF